MNSAKTWFWILLDVLIAAAVVNVVFFVMPLLLGVRASYLPARTITVTAEGKTTTTPDLAEISFSVVSQGQNPSDLSTNNNDKMNAVLQFVSSQGIASSDIATTAYDLQPNYQWDKNTQRNFINGYTLTQTVTVKVHDLSKVANVLGGLAPLGVNQIGGVNFTLNDPETFLAVARADAFNKARTKAQEMASEAGASLGAVVNVSEGSSVPPPRPYYETSASAGGVAMSVPSVAPTIQPGSQDVTDDVTVTYALN